MRKFGEFVHSLSGRYITAEDVGMETADMDIVEMLPLMLLEFQRKEVELETHHLFCMVYVGMKAAAKQQFGSMF
jgi:leucine dehydrogenase